MQILFSQKSIIFLPQEKGGNNKRKLKLHANVTNFFGWSANSSEIARFVKTRVRLCEQIQFKKGGPYSDSGGV